MNLYKSIVLVLIGGSIIFSCGKDEDETTVSTTPTTTPPKDTVIVPKDTTTTKPTDTTTTKPTNNQITVTSNGNIEAVSNGNLTLELEFMSQMMMKGGATQNWTQTNRLPYIDAAKKWVSAITGIENHTGNHTIRITCTVKDETRALGTASILTKIAIGSYDFATKGELVISNDAYVTTGDEAVSLKEFNANILHEIGHIMGFGELTENFVSQDAVYGNVFKAPNSKAVEFYQQIYGVTHNFVPMSDNGAHLYDNVSADDVLRLDNTQLPPLTKEFMANGHTFGKVTFGLLDDIGYIVDYNNVENYTK